ncbi:MAG: aminotransferase [Anaerolineae bacterium]|nr:aminotransferase class I/II-fold pyridoxal phosphate-dependent enzyme [Anaerolineales bacterium]MCQ3972660.1 aminotransferase [Anaerolineae bacterium]
MDPAQRLSTLTESVIRDMTRLAIKHQAINLSQGFPDFDPPPALLEAATRAIQSGHNQYAITWGSARLRAQIAETYGRWYGMNINPETDVTVTCGVTEAIIAALLGTVNPGEKVIIVDPSHENYVAGVRFAGAEPVFVSMRPPLFNLDEAELRAAFAQQPKAIIFNTPHNPSGRVFNRETLQLIADLCQQHNTIAITDEIYEKILYDGREHIPIATLPGMAERTITTSGLTKTYAVTGWRVAWAIAPAALSQPLRTVHDFLTICAPTPLQEAAVTALTLPDNYYAEMSQAYHVRRDKMMAVLEEAGFQAVAPEGAYYVMADYSALQPEMDEMSFAHWLTTAKGVAVVPGSSFYRGDPSLSRGLVRFAFPKQLDTLEEARRRLVAG